MAGMPLAPEDLWCWVASSQCLSGVAPDGQGVRRTLLAEGVRAAALRSAQMASWSQEGIILMWCEEDRSSFSFIYFIFFIFIKIFIYLFI